MLDILDHKVSLYLFQIVVIIGKGTSGIDISLEISAVAKEVHVSSRSEDNVIKLGSRNNIWLHPTVNCLSAKFFFAIMKIEIKFSYIYNVDRVHL